MPYSYISRILNGGEGGIRTHDNSAVIKVFKTFSLNHSDTSPIVLFPRIFLQNRRFCVKIRDPEVVIPI
jgi:hypothetical protein